MRINTNISALNAHRQLGINTDRGASAMEKLSSGLRINRAGDDAAGLAISEKMRGQIRGLTQASRNAQDGISLIQTAEGALNETHAILQRMRELATQSSTDTNTEVDRNEIQKEIDQLAQEITRIADTTEFNTQNLLGGKFEAIFHIGANEAQNITLVVNDMSSAALGVEGNAGLIQEKIAEWGAASDSVLAGAEVGDRFQVQKLGNAQTVSKIEDVQYLLRDTDDNIVGVSVDGATWSIAAATGSTLTSVIADANLGTAVVIDGTEFTAIKSGVIEITGNSSGTLTVKAEDTLVDKPELAAGEYTVVGNSVPLPNDKDLALMDASGKVVAYYGSDKWSDVTGKILFGGENISLVAGDVVTVGGKGIDVSTQAAADKAITVINDAIETVSAERSMLGAMQNRLEHTIANLGTSAENLQAAESRVRDLDMAAEIMEFTKSNILNQAATAMLAQANMAPQTVLQLLG